MVDRVLQHRIPKNETKTIPAEVEKILRARVRAYLPPKIQMMEVEQQIEKMSTRDIDWLVQKITRLEIDQWRKADYTTR